MLSAPESQVECGLRSLVTPGVLRLEGRGICDNNFGQMTSLHGAKSVPAERATAHSDFRVSYLLADAGKNQMQRFLLPGLLLAGFLLAAQTGALAANGPSIENRAARPDELGYRPVDGAEVAMNPPSLTWIHEGNASTYEVEWSRNADLQGAATVQGLPFNTYTHNEPLKPGTYHWRYRFFTSKGIPSNWSRTRSFSVSTNAIEFPMPSRAQQLERVPRGHPRLFVRPEGVAELRHAADPARGNAEAARAFAELQAAAEKLMRSQPTPEPTVRGSIRDADTRAQWWPNRTQTEKACIEAETLAFVYLLTGEPRFGEAARKWILHLASWDPDGPTNFKLNCEAAKPMLFRLPRAYDWAYSALTEEDRKVVQKMMLRRASDAWESGEVGKGTGHLNRPYSSHGNRTFHKLGECAIAFLGEIPDAALWLDYAVNKFYAAYPVWCDDDGGWHEGASYWAGYQSKVVWWLDVAETALGIDGRKKPFFAQVGDFPLYVAPPGTPNIGFGDLSFRPMSSGSARFLEYFLPLQSGDVQEHHSPYWRWWMEQWKTGKTDGILGFLYAARNRTVPAAKAPVDLPQSKAFRGIGVASLHLTLTNSADDIHVLFKSSPFGSQSHGHNPQNSFQLNAFGEALLTTCVYRDWHGSPFHYQWAHSTRAHNAVLVNGEGQVPHSALSRGAIIDFASSGTLDYVVGSAVEAYGGRLDRARRTIAFVKPDLIVVFDDLAATNESTFEFMLHSLRPFKVDESRNRVELQGPKATAEIQYLSSSPLAFRQWDGFEPMPEREFPNQWHLEAGITNRVREIQMLTVVVPARAETSPVPRWTAERIESSSAIGIRFRRGSESKVVAFRKAHQAGSATLGSLQFEKPAALLETPPQ